MFTACPKNKTEQYLRATWTTATKPLQIPKSLLLLSFLNTKSFTHPLPSKECKTELKIIVTRM